MSMTLSPFLEKKFFEYWNERLKKGINSKKYYFNGDCLHTLSDLAKIMGNHFECLFYSKNEFGRSKVFLTSEKNYLKLLMNAYNDDANLFFHNGHDSLCINVFDEEISQVYRHLYISGSGENIKIIEDFIKIYGGEIVE